MESWLLNCLFNFGESSCQPLNFDSVSNYIIDLALPEWIMEKAVHLYILILSILSIDPGYII